MAIARVIYTVRDAKGKDATTEVKLPEALGLAGLTDWAILFATILNDFTSGRIRKCQLTLEVALSEFTSNLLEDNSDVEEVGAFEFVTADGERVKMNVPGMQNSATVGNSDDLDQTDVQTAAIITAMTAGITTATNSTLVQPCSIAEDDIVDVLFAREVHRNSGKRRSY